jgi:hypothetical protein
MNYNTSQGRLLAGISSYANLMSIRVAHWAAVLGFAPLLCASVPPPAGWVPVRWPWADAQSLDLLSGTAVNCLLLTSYPAQLVAAASARGLVTLAVIAPGGDVAAAARRAKAAKVDGLVLESEFPDGAAAGVRKRPRD